MAAVTFCDPMTSSGLPLLLAWLFRVPASNTPVRIGNETGGALRAPLCLEKKQTKKCLQTNLRSSSFGIRHSPVPFPTDFPSPGSPLPPRIPLPQSHPSNESPGLPALLRQDFKERAQVSPLWRKCLHLSHAQKKSSIKAQRHTSLMAEFEAV